MAVMALSFSRSAATIALLSSVAFAGADSVPSQVADAAARYAVALGAPPPYVVREAELSGTRPGQRRKWSVLFDHCEMSIREQGQELLLYSLGGLTGQFSPNKLRARIAPEASPKHFESPAKREAALREFASALGLRTDDWLFEDMPDDSIAFSISSRLRAPTYGYASDANYLQLRFETHDGLISSAVVRLGATITPPPARPITKDDAVEAMRQVVERKSGEMRALGAAGLQWPGDDEVRAKVRLVYSSIDENAWISDEMRAHASGQIHRLAYTYGNDRWFVQIDAETGSVISGSMLFSAAQQIPRGSGTTSEPKPEASQRSQWWSVAVIVLLVGAVATAYAKIRRRLG